MLLTFIVCVCALNVDVQEILRLPEVKKVELATLQDSQGIFHRLRNLRILESIFKKITSTFHMSGIILHTYYFIIPVRQEFFDPAPDETV